MQAGSLKKFSASFSSFIQSRNVYWPPPAKNRSRLIQLPSGKIAFVMLGKRDVDGQLEPHVTIVNSVGHKLMWFDNEEFQQFTALAPRLLGYMDLYKSKAVAERGRIVRRRQDKIERERERSLIEKESIIE